MREAGVISEGEKETEGKNEIVSPVKIEKRKRQNRSDSQPEEDTGQRDREEELVGEGQRQEERKRKTAQIAEVNKTNVYSFKIYCKVS